MSNTWNQPNTKQTLDIFGRGWPSLHPLFGRCAVWGQPDNLGECSHGMLLKEEVLELGGVLRKSKWHEFACPKCGAAAGEGCRPQIKGWHQERIRYL